VVDSSVCHTRDQLDSIRRLGLPDMTDTLQYM